MKRNKLFFAIIVFVFCFILLRPSPSQAQVTCTSLAAPISWSNSGGWDCGAVPSSVDTVIIDSGHFKLVNTNAVAATVTVNGTLEMGNNSNVRSLTVGGDVTVNSGGIFQGSTLGGPATHAVNIGGNVTNDGTFDARTTGTGTNFDVTFTGSTLQTIGGSNAVQFNNLTVNDTAIVAIPAGGTQPTVEGTMTNNGTLSQTQTVNNANVAFLEITDFATTTNKYRGVNVDATGSTDDLGSVTAVVEVVDRSGGQLCTDTGLTSPAYADRCYDISAANAGTAVVRLWALDTELNGIAEMNLAVYHNTGGPNWVELTTNQSTGNDMGSYSYGEGEVTGFSPFLLGHTLTGPTAVAIQDFQATNTPGPFWIVAIIFLLIILSGGLLAFRRR